MAAKKPRKKSGGVEILEINDLKTLKVLTDPARLAIIESLSEPGSVTEVAERLDVPRTRLYHHVKMLEEHGLIRVSSTRKKGALSEKIYEPSARSFTPGAELLESESRPEQVEAIIAGVLDTTREDLRQSLLKHRTDGTPDEENTLYRTLYRLRPEEAKALAGELTELIDRYAGLHKMDEQSDETRLYALTLLIYPSSRSA